MIFMSVNFRQFSLFCGLGTDSFLSGTGSLGGGFLWTLMVAFL